MGTTVLVMLAISCALLFLAAFGRALNASVLTPALKAGMGFFGCMTVACITGVLWLHRRSALVEELIVGERIVATRTHREMTVFRASHCLFFAGVCESVSYRKALSGLVVGTHVFYLEDGAYLTEAGVQQTVGHHNSRSSVVFMRAFQAHALRHKYEDPPA